jgi:hypothetical protein
MSSAATGSTSMILKQDATYENIVLIVLDRGREIESTKVENQEIIEI